MRSGVRGRPPEGVWDGRRIQEMPRIAARAAKRNIRRNYCAAALSYSAKDGDTKMNKPALTFRIFQGSNLVRRETVRQDIVKIGKDPKSHLRVDCELAARMHAVLEV